MEKVIVNIGKKTYNCQVAKTEEEKRKGLMGVENLPPDEYSLDYGLIGTGCSVDECIEDIKLAYAEMQQLFEEQNRYFEEVEMVFSYDSSMTDCL